MTWTPPPRPAWVAALNASEGHMGGGERLAPLDTPSLLHAARTRTGLDDFGDSGFRAPLNLLCESLEREATLHLAGRLLVHSEITRCLENRLRIEQTYRQRPEIAAERIERPILVTGTGRSGTSILHELLAEDPSNRVPRTWEVLYPCPPPEAATAKNDPRIARADHDVKLWEEIVPEYRTMHENGGNLPQECIFVTAHQFASSYWGGNNPVPSYARWLAGADLSAAFAYHRRMLQLLQWRCPAERWVLKCPSHLTALPAFLAAYPDAHIVLTHRDPLAVMGSLTSLVATLRWMRSNAVDYRAIVRGFAAGTAASLEMVMRQRDAGEIPAERIHDVRYRDLVDDPWRTIRALYDSLGLELSAGAEDRMRRYLAAKPQARHGAHRYAFADTGLDRERERARYREYQERYGVVSEV